jgi:hypothetical protein
VPRRNDDRRKKQRCDNCDRHHDDRPKSSRATQFRRRDQITPYATDQTFCLKLSTLHIYVFNTIFSTAFLQLLFLRSFSMFNISVFKILHSFSIMLDSSTSQRSNSRHPETALTSTLLLHVHESRSALWTVSRGSLATLSLLRVHGC